MSRKFLVSLFIVSLLAANPFGVPAATSAPAVQSLVSPGGAVVLCLPGIYTSQPGDCVPAGPSQYLTDLAAQGITLPITPLPARLASPDLAQVNVSYGEVVTENAPVYGSLEDAIKRNRRNAVQRLNGDFVFISYTDAVEMDGRRYYMVGPNQWMIAADISRIGVLPRFQGLEFSQTPVNDFGWALPYWVSEPLQTKRTPGYHSADYSGHVLNLNDVVQIFAEETVDDERWYLVGPDEWAPAKYIARVSPNPKPPDGVTTGRWIEVNLQEQTIIVYDNYRLVFATVIASGADPFWTRPGLFQIYEKHESTPMRGAFEADLSDAYYLEDVPWTLYYDEARALHGAYWRAKMGFPQSHGCVNMTVGDANWIFHWADIGDWVYVWDPSGETPTDPSLYSAGGY